MIKKILLGLVLFVGLLVVIFFAFGFFKPSINVETKILVNKPRSVAWKYFIDESKLKEWMTNIKSIEKISGEPNKVGSKFRMTFEENGDEIVMPETMTEFRDNEVFGFTLENEVINDDVRITFIDRGDKTEIVQTDKLNGGNIFWRSLFAILESTFHKNTVETYEKLKVGIEAQP